MKEGGLSAASTATNFEKLGIKKVMCSVNSLRFGIKGRTLFEFNLVNKTATILGILPDHEYDKALRSQFIIPAVMEEFV